jgi:hypothetical protein
MADAAEERHAEAMPDAPAANGNGAAAHAAHAAPPAAAATSSPKAPPPVAPQPAAPSPTPPPPPPRTVASVDRALDAPALVAVDGASMTLQWAPAPVRVAAPELRVVEYALSYALEMQQVGTAADGAGASAAPRGDRWSAQYAGPATYVQVKGLRPGRRYAVRVAARLAASDPAVEVRVAPPSAPLLVSTPAAPPGAPGAPAAARRELEALALRWAPPAEGGGHALAAYALEARPAPDGHAGPPTAEGTYEVYRGAAPEALLRGLRPGMSYTLRVRAESAMGAGPWAAATLATLAAPPGAPGAPTAALVGAGGAALRWAPAPGNGAEVRRYAVEADDGRGGGWAFVGHAREPRFDVAGLAPGAAVRFRVRAESAEGAGPWSAEAEARAAPGLPPAPGPPARVSAGAGELALAWAPPPGDGGASIEAYEVEARLAAAGNEGDWLLMFRGAAARCSLSGLRPGAEYAARVRAVSALGAGPFSPAAVAATRPAAPAAPGAPRAASARPTALKVAWPAPEHDGGAAVTGYRLEGRFVGRLEARAGAPAPSRDAFRALYAGPDRFADVCDLEPGARYEFRAAAVNAHGAGAWSAASACDTLVGAPLAPGAPAVAPAAAPGALALSWRRPDGQGGAVAGFEAQACEVAALLEARARTAAAPPSAPGSSSGSVDGGDEARAAAKAARRAADAVAAAFRPVYQGPETSCVAAGLKANTEYAFRVRARNAAGAGAWSPLEARRTPPAPPGAPRALAAAAAAGAAAVLAARWEPPAEDNGAAVGEFQLDAAPRPRGAAAPAWRSAYTGAAAACVVADLKPGRAYLLRARAGNACGWGAWSELATAQTAAAPPAAPPAPTFSGRTAAGVRVRWAPPDEENGSAVTGYEAERRAGAAGAWAPAYRGDEPGFKAAELLPNEEHHFRVRALSAAGAGAWSPAARLATGLAPPHAPAGVAAAAVPGDAAVDVYWTPPSAAPERAACIGFEVQATGEAAPGGGAPAPPARQTAGAKATEARLSGLVAGVAYSVRVRAVGAEGAGHGEWSAPAAAALPEAERPPPPPPAEEPAEPAADEAGPVAARARLTAADALAKAAAPAARARKPHRASAGDAVLAAATGALRSKHGRRAAAGLVAVLLAALLAFSLRWLLLFAKPEARANALMVLAVMVLALGTLALVFMVLVFASRRAEYSAWIGWYVRRQLRHVRRHVRRRLRWRRPAAAEAAAEPEPESEEEEEPAWVLRAPKSKKKEKRASGHVKMVRGKR